MFKQMLVLFLYIYSLQIYSVTKEDCTPTQSHAKDPLHCYNKYKKHGDLKCLQKCLKAKGSACAKQSDRNSIEKCVQQEQVNNKKALKKSPKKPIAKPLIKPAPTYKPTPTDLKITPEQQTQNLINDFQNIIPMLNSEQIAKISLTPDQIAAALYGQSLRLALDAGPNCGGSFHGGFWDLTRRLAEDNARRDAARQRAAMTAKLIASLNLTADQKAKINRTPEQIANQIALTGLTEDQASLLTQAQIAAINSTSAQMDFMLEEMRPQPVSEKGNTTTLTPLQISNLNLTSNQIAAINLTPNQISAIVPDLAIIPLTSSQIDALQLTSAQVTKFLQANPDVLGNFKLTPAQITALKPTQAQIDKANNDYKISLTSPIFCERRMD